MKAIVNLLRNPWFMSLLGVLLLILLEWLVGPLVAIAGAVPLEAVSPRVFIAVLLLVVWGTAFIVSRWRGKQASEKLANELGSSPAGGKGNERVEALASRMREALGHLKKTGKGRTQYLYQIPWYIMIGPPGAGKTTALRNCGLRFPLDQATELQGVGGTRNCEWYFTDQAVFLDTAGRYTTQDSDQEVDRGEWLGFLDILKKYRRRQPVNGVLVAISIVDILRYSDSERKTHALAVRKRIAELNERLGVRVPVYVLFTKLDLLAGFVEFFDDLGKEDRDQVWGTTFPMDNAKGIEVVTRFGADFDALLERLRGRVAERIQHEIDVGRRGQVLGFPQQMTAAKRPMGEFLDEMFRSSRYDATPLLRGVYFTSGTQYGSPIDRMMGAMSAAFGLPQTAFPPFSGQGRSYFLARLLTEVVFPEASLVGSDRAVERRNTLIRLGAGAAAAVAVAGFTAAFLVSYLGNIRLIDDVAAAAAKYQDAVVATDPGKADLPDVARLLDQSRVLPTGFDSKEAQVPVLLTFGLYQGDKLASQTVDAYHRGLSYLLLPKLTARLEGQLRSNMGQPDFLFEGLQVYLMLGKQVQMNREQVKRWFTLDVNSRYPGPQYDDARASLGRHIDALLDEEFATLPLDTGLIDQIRAVLRQIPPAARAYALIKQSSLASKLPEWTIPGKAGPASGQVFARASGRPLGEGVPGLFTREGFYTVVLPQIPEITREVLKDDTLLNGHAGGAGATIDHAAAIQRDILNLYYDEYARRWDGILADVVTVPLRNVDHAAEVLNTLSSPTSPLKQLILAVVEETTLTQPPGGSKKLSEVKDLADNLGKAVMDERLTKLMGATGVPDQIPGKPVEDRFRRLHDLAQGSPSQLDGIIETLGRLYRQTSQMATAGSQGAAMLAAAGGGGGGGSVAPSLAGAAANMPAPFDHMLGAVAKSSTALTVEGVRSQVNTMWQSNVLPLCQQLTASRYPFVKSAPVDVTVEDFTRLFGPNGLVVQFYTSNLARFVDTSRRPWRWQKVDGSDLGLSSDALAQFERAMAVSEGFFRGGAAPQASFDLVPVSLDTAATEVSVEIGTQSLSYSHGPLLPVHMQWPSPAPQRTTLAFSPPIPGKNSSLMRDGPWSFFRLLEESQVTPGPVPERFTITFAVGGRSAGFELQASSVNNPFDLRDLRQFRCPSSL